MHETIFNSAILFRERYEKYANIYDLICKSSQVTLVASVGILIFFFTFFARREKQSLERYLKEVPTVEEHQKLNKTISLKHFVICQRCF